MPPPPPDRWEFLYRRHDGGGGGGGDPLPPPATPRWRDSPPLRDHARPSPRRAASSASSDAYYRQGDGAYDRPYPDEPLGYTPSRSDRYWLDEEGGGGSGYKGFSRYGGRREGSDIRGSYRRSPFRSYGGGDFARSHQEPPPPPLRRSPIRSVAVPISYDPPSDREDREHHPRATPWQPLRRREGRDMRGSYRRSPFRSYGGDLARSQQEPPPPPMRRSPLRSVAVPISYDPPGDRADREDREHQPRVTPWRPLRRRESRSDAGDPAAAGPLSAGQSDAARAASEKNAPDQPADAAAQQMAEDEAPRKKPRLGWGQGLAKYEKRQVPGSSDPDEPVADGSPDDVKQKVDVGAGAPASAPCASPVAAPSPASAPWASPVPAPSSGTASAPCPSPVVAPAPAPSSAPASAPCASPVVAPAPAPSSAPVSSSPVPEDKSCELAANTATVSNKDIPGAEAQAYNDEIPAKLGQLDGDPIGSLANVLADLLQHEDSCSGDSRRLTNTNKLSLLKENIAKELEKTELEIDSLECELKSVITESENRAPENAQNPSPSSETSKVPVKPEACETSSPLKEQGEITPCKFSLEENADANVVELMEVETAPLHNVIAVSSEESVACPGAAKAQLAAAADVAPLKSSEGTGSPHIDADSHRQDPSPCNGIVSSVNADGDNDSSIRLCSHHVDSNNLIPSIIAANIEITKECNELVFKPLPADQPCLDLSALSHFCSQRKNDLSIRKKLAIHKTKLRFKEQTLTFKFKVLRHLWKEDVRLLAVRKQRPKSSKRTDQSNRASHSGSQRQRSSNRSRLGMPGNLSTFPTTEISDVANKMFTEFQFKRCRNFLQMPALIIDEKEKTSTKFVSKNGLIEDPVSVEKERAVINPWTQEEKEVLMQMLASFGKDFSKISSFLQHKTTADCVEFYYKHHKSDSFREVKKLLDRRQHQPPSNYLGTKSGKKWNPEGNAASLDMLGVASVVAAHGLDYSNRMEKNSAKSILRTSYRSDSSAVVKGSSDKDIVANVSLHERESVAADVLAGICGTLSPEGMGSCITSSADPGQKIGATRMEYLPAPEVHTSFDDEGTLSDQECEVDPVDWNDDEKLVFIESMNNYGKDFAQISSCVKSKSFEQCKVFFSKARISLGLDMIHQRTTDTGLPTCDTSGGRSGTDGACAAEMDSAICSTQSSLKMEIDACPAADGTNQGHTLSGITFKEPKTDASDGPDGVDIKLEEGEIKAEDENSNVRAGHSQLIEATQESSPSCAPIDINSSENTESMQNTEHESQVSVHGNGTIDFPCEQPAGAHLQIRSSLHNIEIIQPNKASERICTPGSGGPSFHATESAPMKAANLTPSVCLPEAPQSSKASAVICTEVSSMEGPSHHSAERSLTSSVCLPGDRGSKEHIVHFSDMAGVSSIRPSFASSYQQSVPTDLLPSKPKQQVTPLTPKDLMPVQFSSDLPDPTSIRFEGIASITSPNFGDHAKKVISTSGPQDINKFPIFNEHSRNQHDALFRNIDGYMQHRRDQRVVADLPAFSESTVSGTVEISHSDQFTLTKYQNVRSGCSGLSNTSAGFLLTGRSEEVRQGQLNSCSQKVSTESQDQVKRPGDVKLFGKILSHQSSLQSCGSSLNGSKTKPPSPQIDKSAAIFMNSSRDHMVYSSRSTSTAHLGQDERVVRSYNFDGSTVQPESVFRVAKCQRSLASVPFYSSAKNGTLGVFAEYQQPLMQQLPSDPKRLESFADLQKRNGIELISGFQQPGKASRLGGAGILVSTVSDPVAVLKAQYGGGSNILDNDADPWKDIGNR